MAQSRDSYANGGRGPGIRTRGLTVPNRHTRSTGGRRPSLDGPGELTDGRIISLNVTGQHPPLLGFRSQLVLSGRGRSGVDR